MLVSPNQSSRLSYPSYKQHLINGLFFRDWDLCWKYLQTSSKHVFQGFLMDLTVIRGLKITLCFIVLPQAISIWYFSIEMDGQVRDGRRRSYWSLQNILNLNSWFSISPRINVGSILGKHEIWWKLIWAKMKSKLGLNLYIYEDLYSLRNNVRKYFEEL